MWLLFQLISERIKFLNLLFHLKSMKVNGGREVKALVEVEQSFEGKQESGSS